MALIHTQLYRIASLSRRNVNHFGVEQVWSEECIGVASKVRERYAHPFPVPSAEVLFLEVAAVAEFEEKRQDTLLSRGIHVRRGRVEDEFATFEVMRRTMGYEMVWTQHIAMRHHLRLSGGASFWVAEETPRFGAARVVGYARSVVREGVWSLTEFFVLPGHHRQGIGGVLLLRCLEDGATEGADTRLVLASHHPAADALYIRKAKCIPRIPMLLLAGSIGRLRADENASLNIFEKASRPDDEAGPLSLKETGSGLFAEPLLPESAIQNAILDLDRRIVGYGRPQEHLHWASQMGGLEGASRIFRRAVATPYGWAPSPEIAGYAYIGAESSGPVLAVDPADQPRMIAYVAELARKAAQTPGETWPWQPVEQYWAVPGTNEVVLKWLLDRGWQIVFQYLFMCTRPMGEFDRYVCCNPLYVL